MAKKSPSRSADKENAESASTELDATIAGQIEAINKSQAVIEFEMDGTILRANDNFLNAMGYTLDEVEGRHHSIFVDEATRTSAEYRDFWAQLNRGEFLADEYRRIAKDGSDVWIQATYNPILDDDGKPFRVIKYASPLTYVESPARYSNKNKIIDYLDMEEYERF